MEHKGLSLLVMMIVAALMANALPAIEPKSDDDIPAAKEVADDMETAASYYGGYGRRPTAGDSRCNPCTAHCPSPCWPTRPTSTTTTTPKPYHYGETTTGHYTTSSTSTSTTKPTDGSTKPPPCPNCHSCTFRHPIFINICFDVILGLGRK